MRNSISGPRDQDLNRRQMLNHLGHPGAPIVDFLTLSTKDLISFLKLRFLGVVTKKASAQGLCTLSPHDPFSGSPHVLENTIHLSASQDASPEPGEKGPWRDGTCWISSGRNWR